MGKIEEKNPRPINIKEIVKQIQNQSVSKGMQMGIETIKNLDARNAKLLKALKDIAEGCSFPEDEVQEAIVTRARQAIKETEES